MVSASQVRQKFDNHELFCRESLSIRDKSGRSVPFLLQPAQRKLNEAIERCRAAGKPARILFLKARQVMVSTGTAAEFFHRVPFAAGQKALIVAHDKEAAKNIFGYYCQLHDGYQPFGGVVGLPAVDTDAKAAGKLAYSNGSYFRVASANNLESGRSFSLRYLHLSEYAFWRDAATLMTGLMQAVPDDPDTIVVIESTANGAGGDFYQRWQEATDPNSDSEWIALFFAWHEHPEYRRPVEEAAAFQASLSQEEKELRQRFGLDLEQLHWRRWCIKVNCGGSLDSFKQEYPSHPEEAFLYSGRPRFEHKSLSRMPIKGDGLVGELWRSEEAQGIKKPLLFLPNEDGKGAMVVYKKPAPGKRYVIGVDIAEGIDASESNRRKGNTAKDPDYSVAIVCDGDTGEQVAKVRGRIEPGPFAEYVAGLGEWYNWSFVTFEANSVGIAFIESLLRDGYPPALIYRRNPDPTEQFAPDAYNSIHELGWRSNVSTRVQLISSLDMAIRQMGILVVDAVTLRELRAFVVKANGKAEAQDGDHDDEVIALGLCVLGIQSQPLDRRLAGIQPTKLAASQSTGMRKYGIRKLDERGERRRW